MYIDMIFVRIVRVVVFGLFLKLYIILVINFYLIVILIIFLLDLLLFIYFIFNIGIY